MVVTVYGIGESLEIGVITSDGRVVPRVQLIVREVPSTTDRVAVGFFT